jgi:hypothetical protein
MRFESGQRTWRWMALGAIVVNVAFTNLSRRLPFGEGSIEQITRRHQAFFTPADYACAIWGLIYLTTLWYAIHQLVPSQRNVDAYDRLAKPLVAVNVLGMAWPVVFRNDLIAISAVTIAIMLGFSIALFVRATGAVRRREISKWILLPASLWFAWLSVATIANTSLWLVAAGWADTNQLPLAFAGIGIAVLLGFLIGNRYRNWIYPLVIAWAAVAIWWERKSDVQIIAMAALLAAVLMVAWAAYCAFRAKRDRRRFRIFRDPIDAG